MSEKKELIHYAGYMGEFDYDPNMYAMLYDVDTGFEFLHFKDNYVGPISLPKGCKDTRRLFEHCNIKEGCYLADFDTSDVDCMMGMFYKTKIPKGFTLGDRFDTSAVTHMNSMFYGATLPDNFSLGDKFNTSNVKRAGGMFYRATLPENFTLNNEFNMSNAEDTRFMFDGATINGERLTDKFGDVNAIIDYLKQQKQSEATAADKNAAKRVRLGADSYSNVDEYSGSGKQVGE